MRFDRSRQSEILECDKNAITRRVSLPPRDIRILAPLGREKVMVVNLDFIKAIINAEEVLLLNPLCQEELPFVEQLRQQLPLKSPNEGKSELPFEFQVLELALEVVCTYLDSCIADLERYAYPVLDELAMNVSIKSLERVRSLKGNLTRLLACVQKVKRLQEQEKIIIQRNTHVAPQAAKM